MNRLFLKIIKNNSYIRKNSVSKKTVLNSQICKQDNLFNIKKNKIKKELYKNTKNINIPKNNSQVEKQDNLYIL